MIAALDLEGFRGAECRVRCFPHILNLAVKVRRHYIQTFSWFSQGMKAILSQFSHKLEDEEVPPALAPTSRKKRPAAQRQAHARSMATLTRVTARQTLNSDSDSDDDDSRSSYGGDDDDDSDVETLDQDEDVIRAAEAAQQADLIEAEQSAELEFVLTDSEQNVASMALAKVSGDCCPQMKMPTDCTEQLTKLAYKINNSPSLVEEIEKLCKAAKLKPLRMIKPVDTRWDSTSHMISRAIQLKRIIEDVCSKQSIASQYGTRPLKLKREEWRILEELSPLLGVRAVTLPPGARSQL
jgi:hypothetical protein